MSEVIFKLTNHNEVYIMRINYDNELLVNVYDVAEIDHRYK